MTNNFSAGQSTTFFKKFCGTFCNRLVGLISLSLVVTGCSMGGKRDGAPDSGHDISAIPDATPRVEPLSKQGNPVSYAVFGRRYYVMETARNYVKKGTASWYGTKFHGRRTSSGEIYDMYKMTAAHKTLPLPSFVQVTNLENKRQVTVRVNDRGPFHQDRLIDLSYVAARKLGITTNGTARVEVRAIGPAALQGQSATSGTLMTTEVSATTRAKPDVDNGPPFENYFLQVGAFSQISNAEQLFSRLTNATTRPVQISKTVMSVGRKTENNSDSLAEKTTLYRVRLGPFPDREQARHVATEMSALGLENSQLITEPVTGQGIAD